MMLVPWLVVLLGGICGIQAVSLDRTGQESFLNHRLVDVNITTEEQQQYVIDMDDVGNMGLDMWLVPTLTRTGRLRVPPESIDLFMTLMNTAGISSKIRHHNIKQLNDDTYSMPSEDPALYKDFIEGVVRHNAYYRLANLDAYMSNFATFSGVTKGYLARSTYEGRDTPYIEITGGSSSNKKRIFIEAGIHAREWVSPASAMYFIDRMLHRRDLDADASFLYNNFEWYIVPVTNPDGYEYSHTSYRYWRKNRSIISGCGSSRGVDLNRNFDSMWGGSGSSGSCSSDSFRGPSVFSEIETQNLRDKVQDIQNERGPISAYLSIHSFSQLILTPYGFAQNTYPPNNDHIVETSNLAKDAIFASDGRTYRVGSSADILSVIHGGSRDWARQTEDIPYAITFELRPSSGGLEGFVLPAAQIAPCSKEIWDAIYAIAGNL
ncbi:zinc carboxypeptidase-like [Haliotis rufescens]|uniref:zinc carboxypeptidase-like n=1 Tax=Haliotis rufescens TaxID=6454 RepID=UPI00201F2916|nr:zinc carboxypeptidase-like [Haliotis rufescens]